MNLLMTNSAQRGSALITAMVFLTILTILGLSTMSTSRLEIRMAANTQFAHQAFQAAESGIAEVMGALDKEGSTSEYLSTSGTSARTFYFNANSKGLYTDPSDSQKYAEKSDISVDYLTAGQLIEGFSLGSNFSAYHFGITSTGQTSAGGESVHVQGFYIVGPG